MSNEVGAMREGIRAWLRRAALPELPLAGLVLLFVFGCSSAPDPWQGHVWLGIPQAVAMVGTIRDTLAEIDEANAGEYRKNAEAYIDRLKALHAEGKKALADRKVRRIISSHEALGYFAKSFDLEVA